MFTHAIVRKPAETFAEGLTSVDLGLPHLATALAQHAAYCQTLQRCGLDLTTLDADPHYPDSTFVEDAAVLTAGCAILTHPGAPSRQGEVPAIHKALEPFYDHIEAIQPPGTLDGGDVCEAGTHFFIGVSARTNEDGARQLVSILAREGCTSTLIDVRRVPGILHLKSGIASVGDGNLLVIPALQDHDAFQFYHRLVVPQEEAYAANCVRVNDFVLLAQGYPQVENIVDNLGWKTISLEMSEFAKMDGGLSCLSLRF
jgi:dimethylargininase